MTSMKPIEGYIQFLDNPTQVAPIIQQIISDESSILRSHIFISFYDDKSFIFDEDPYKSDTLLPYVLLESLKYGQYYEMNSCMYIDVRGSMIHNNALFDLKFSSNPKNGLVASLGKNFDEWIHRYVPNFYNISITSSDDIYNCMQIFKDSINEIKMLIPKTKNECPRIYIADFVKADRCDKKNYYVGRWIFIDIPCSNNSLKGLEVLSWLQSEHFSNSKKCNDKIEYDPLYAAMQDFIEKNVRTTFCFMSQDEKLKAEFNNIKKIFSQTKISLEDGSIISAKKYNKAWYSALNGIKEICFLARAITYVPAITGKEGKKKKKVSDVKKMESTLKDVVEKFSNSNISDNLALKNHKIFEAKIGFGSGKSIITIISDVRHAIMNLDKKLVDHIKNDHFDSFFTIDEDSDLSDDYTSSEDDSDDSSYEDEEESDVCFVEFGTHLDQWDLDHEPLIQSFIEEINFQPKESLSDIIDRACPNIYAEYAFIYQTMKKSTKKLNTHAFDSYFDDK